MTHDHRTWFGRIIDALTPGPHGAPGDYANGGSKLFSDDPPTRPGEPGAIGMVTLDRRPANVVGSPQPTTAPKARRWKLYEGHGEYAGLVLEDPDTKRIVVEWDHTGITKPPPRLTWVDIEALRDDAADWPFYNYTLPMRFRPIDHDDIEGL